MAAALGVTWHHFIDGTVGGLDSFDVGLSRQVNRYLGIGLVVRDVFVPEVNGQRLQRTYEGEVLVRPIGTSRVEVGLGGFIGERDGNWGVRSRISAGLIRGVRLLGAFNIVERRFQGGATDPEFRASAGLEINFGGLAVGAIASGSSLEGEGPNLGGGTLMAQIVTPTELGVFSPSKRIERLDLSAELTSKNFTSILLRLRKMEKDEGVVGVVVRAEGFRAGWATLNELRSQLKRLRKAGKKVVFHAVSGSTRTYFLGSVADKIYVDPAGGIRLQGVSSVAMYFKGLLENLGVEAEFIRIEEYKSAPESFTRAGPTEPALRMRNELMDELFGHMVAGIAKERKISVKRVRKLIDEGPYTAGDLEKKTELVDGIANSDEFNNKVQAVFGGAYPIGSSPYEKPDTWSYPEVAVIYLTGDIAGGNSRSVPVLGKKVVGGDTIAKAIKAARADSRVKAIVLRINSPGGSALASELMAREVFKTRGVKPIICSLGDVAASGGYFAAAGCDQIFADPMTVTGSIGIFNGKFDISGLLSRLGISWHVYKRGAHSDIESQYRRFTEEERVFVKEKLRYYYGRFIGAVAKGRKMTKKQVDDIGRGHIWSGLAAKKNGLVDKFGGVVDAIEAAKMAAGLGQDDQVWIRSLPVVKTGLLSKLLGTGAAPFGQSGEQLFPLLGVALKAFPASVWVQPEVPQARLPFVLAD